MLQEEHRGLEHDFAERVEIGIVVESEPNRQRWSKAKPFRDGLLPAFQWRTDGDADGGADEVVAVLAIPGQGQAAEVPGQQFEGLHGFQVTCDVECVFGCHLTPALALRCPRNALHQGRWQGMPLEGEGEPASQPVVILEDVIVGIEDELSAKPLQDDGFPIEEQNRVLCMLQQEKRGLEHHFLEPVVVRVPYMTKANTQCGNEVKRILE